MSKRKVSNPLALAVLACVVEKPMHPYEMATTLRERAKDESIKLNYGSLYNVVESLQRHGLIEPRETVKRGQAARAHDLRASPTPGAHEFERWLTELISTPVKEYTQYEAGLSLHRRARSRRGGRRPAPALPAAGARDRPGGSIRQVHARTCPACSGSRPSTASTSRRPSWNGPASWSRTSRAARLEGMEHWRYYH